MHHRSPCRDLAIPCADIEGFQAMGQTVAGVLVFRLVEERFSLALRIKAFSF
jgi:hypothetical protein